MAKYKCSINDSNVSCESQSFDDVISASNELKDSLHNYVTSDISDINIKKEYQLLYEKIVDVSSGQKSFDDIYDSDDSESSSSSIHSINYIVDPSINTNVIETSSDECDTDDSVTDNEELTSITANLIPSILSRKFDTKSMQGNRLMFPASNLLVSDVLLMIETFVVEKNFSEKDEKDFINFIKVLAGPEFEHWNASKYLRSKCYDPPPSTINLNFFCSKCNCILDVKDIKSCSKKELKDCDSCQQQCELSSNAQNNFVTVDLEYQLQLLLSDPCIQKSLLKNLQIIKSNDKKNNNNIRDVYDSELYKKLQYEFPGILTLNFNTDGAPAFKKSRTSFWPIQAYVNELPPKLRFANRVLAGLYCTQKEPKPELMRLYLSSFCKQIKHLQEKGVQVIDHSTGKMLTFKFHLFAGCVDSVARPVIQNRLQYSGYYGCSWCYSNGMYIGGAVRYLITEDNFELRSHEKYEKEALIAEKINKFKPESKKIATVLGVKGKSAFLDYDDFLMAPLLDCVWGFPVDEQHGRDLGITKQHWHEKTTDVKNKDYSLKPKDLKEIDKRISCIKPTHDIPRLPLPTSQFAENKANQWSAWARYYCIPCLDGILKADHFISLALYVQSIWRLSKAEITEDDLQNSDYDLLKFFGEWQLLHGESSMTFNVHSAIHSVNSVKKSGPTWATSTYPFEDGIGLCKKLINGPRGISHQIAKKMLKRLTLRYRIPENTRSSECQKYCESLFKPRFTANHKRISDDLLLLGKGKKDASIENVIKFHLGNSSADIEIYERCIYKHSVMHSDTYHRAQRTNDSVVSLKTGVTLRIKCFVVVNNDCYVYGQELVHRVATFSHGVQLHHIHEVYDTSDMKVENIYAIKE